MEQIEVEFRTKLCTGNLFKENKSCKFNYKKNIYITNETVVKIRTVK